jgi:hypothetical protein
MPTLIPPKIPANPNNKHNKIQVYSLLQRLRINTIQVYRKYLRRR